MINRWVFRIVLFIVGCLLVWWLASCNTVKGKRSQTVSSDSTAVKTANTTAGSKTETREETKGSFEKTTTTVPVIIRDTISNKTYIYPSTTIYEKGETQTVTQTTKTDSLIIALIESINKKETSEIKEKDKTTKLNATPFIMAGVVILAMFAMVLWFVNKKFDRLAGMIPGKT